MKRGENPTCGFPLFEIARRFQIHPFRALEKDRGFRSLRRATKGAAFGNRKFFEKNLTKNLGRFGDCGRLFLRRYPIPGRNSTPSDVQTSGR